VDQLAKTADLARAIAHAQQILEADGVKYFFGEWKLNPDLLQEAATLLENGQQLPDALGAYVGYALRVQLHKLNKTKARLKEKNNWRNFFIAKAVHEMQQFGFKPTRNRASKKEKYSGCSIVAKVIRERDLDLGLHEPGVENVWGAFQHRRALANCLLSPSQKSVPESTGYQGLFSRPPFP
jgi:hypothetical protein